MKITPSGGYYATFKSIFSLQDILERDWKEG